MPFLPLAALAAILIGAGLRLVPGLAPFSTQVWLIGLIVTGAPVLTRTVRGAMRGHFAADLVATLAIVSAVLLDQPFVGLVIVLMQTGGEALESLARGRASRALRELEAATPRIAHRVRDDRLEDVRADEVAVGESLLVLPGELVPCDGLVTDGRSHVDTSAITGEPIPLSATPGTRLMSGSRNLDGPLTVHVHSLARESQYARIVELVRSAQASKAPIQRIADRYAVWFTPLTLAVCAVAYLVSHDPMRVLAVLAVATPCPLILATPVAILGGIDRAARRQIILREGAALERLASVTAAVFDKTGTLTLGEPRVRSVFTARGTPEHMVLRCAGAVERGSGHLLARTLVRAADERGIVCPTALDVVEAAGRGVSGFVEGRRVTVGSRAFVLEQYPQTEPDLTALEPPGPGLRAYVVVDGELIGIVDYADAIRADAHDVLARLTALGVRRTLVLSGDHEINVQAVAAAVGIDDARGDLLPQDKVDVVRQLVGQGEAVMAVGDGTNDAPALSAATVGVALAGHGGGITAEAADVVILTDDLARVADALWISRRTMRIARQSIWVGLGLSAVGMMGASIGLLTPVAGALLQEAIDLAVIANALRAADRHRWPMSGAGWRAAVPSSPTDGAPFSDRRAAHLPLLERRATGGLS
jgi:heavy metal translocating P-type ATPase